MLNHRVTNADHPQFAPAARAFLRVGWMVFGTISKEFAALFTIEPDACLVNTRIRHTQYYGMAVPAAVCTARRGSFFNSTLLRGFLQSERITHSEQRSAAGTHVCRPCATVLT